MLLFAYSQLQSILLFRSKSTFIAGDTVNDKTQNIAVFQYPVSKSSLPLFPTHLCITSYVLLCVVMVTMVVLTSSQEFTTVIWRWDFFRLISVSRDILMFA